MSTVFRGIVTALITAIVMMSAPLASAQTSRVIVSTENDIVGISFELRELLDVPADSQEELAQLIRKRPELLDTDPGVGIGATHTATSDGIGDAYFTGIRPGVYQLRQTSVGPNGIMATPMLVYVARDSKDLLVNVKPQALVISKSAHQARVPIGSEVTYHIAADIPWPVSRNLEIRDVLSPSLSYISVTNVRMTGRSTAELKLNEDYLLAIDGQAITISFSEQGYDTLAQAREASPRTRVEFDLKVRANSVGEIDNVAVLSDGAFVLATSVPARIRVYRPTEPSTSSHTSSKPGGGSGAQGPPGHGSTPQGGSSVPGNLAQTGASVIGIVIIGLVALILGVLFMRKRREDSGEKRS